ncbi:MAG: hypothetical protein VB997_08200 [Opitutales bacterium]
MTFRWIEWFLVITVLVFLCNCATTNPDSSDDPSARIDLPPDEESKDNDPLPEGGEEPKEDQSTSVKDTAGNGPLTIETALPEENPAIGTDSGQDSSDLAKAKDSSSLGAVSSLDGESEAASPFGGESGSEALASGDKPNKNNPTEVAIGEPKSSGSIPVAESSPDLVTTLGTELKDVPLGEPLENLAPKGTPRTSVLPEDNPENAQSNSGTSGFSELIDVTLPENPQTPDESELTIASSERPGTNEPPDASILGVSGQEKPSLPDSEKSPERGLDGRNANDQDTRPVPNTLNSTLEAANSENDIFSGLGRSNSPILVPKDFASDESGASLGESLSLSFSSSSSNGRETISEKNQRPYLHLSQWLSRGSPEGSTGDDVYLGRSDPEVEPELKTYIDESPLVGLNPHIPWEYDAIAELLQARDGEVSDSSHSRRYGYEVVRKLLARDNSFSLKEPVREFSTAPMDYENVLRWLERRRDEAGVNRSKLSAKRKYSKALQWIRNEGRRD